MFLMLKCGASQQLPPARNMKQKNKNQFEKKKLGVLIFTNYPPERYHIYL